MQSKCVATTTIIMNEEFRDKWKCWDRTMALTRVFEVTAPKVSNTGTLYKVEERRAGAVVYKWSLQGRERCNGQDAVASVTSPFPLGRLRFDGWYGRNKREKERDRIDQRSQKTGRGGYGNSVLRQGRELFSAVGTEEEQPMLSRRRYEVSSKKRRREKDCESGRTWF